LDGRARLDFELASKEELSRFPKSDRLLLQVHNLVLDGSAKYFVLFHPFHPAANPTPARLIADMGRNANQGVDKDDDKPRGLDDNLAVSPHQGQLHSQQPFRDMRNS
jgi:hypothetical protein